MDRKIIAFELTNIIEITPINENDFDNFVDELMNKVTNDIFEAGFYCGCSMAKPIFEDGNQ